MANYNISGGFADTHDNLKNFFPTFTNSNGYLNYSSQTNILRKIIIKYCCYW